MGDGLRLDAGQLGRRVGAGGQVESFENLHDLPVMFGHWSSGGARVRTGTSRTKPFRGATMVDGADLWCPPAWRSRVRQAGIPCPPTWIVRCPFSRHNGHADLLREAVDGETGEYSTAVRLGRREDGDGQLRTAQASHNRRLNRPTTALRRRAEVRCALDSLGTLIPQGRSPRVKFSRGRGLWSRAMMLRQRGALVR